MPPRRRDLSGSRGRSAGRRRATSLTPVRRPAGTFRPAESAYEACAPVLPRASRAEVSPHRNHRGHPVSSLSLRRVEAPATCGPRGPPTAGLTAVLPRASRSDCAPDAGRVGAVSLIPSPMSCQVTGGARSTWTADRRSHRRPPAGEPRRAFASPGPQRELGLIPVLASCRSSGGARSTWTADRRSHRRPPAGEPL